jgi:hypothetical protein
MASSGSVNCRGASPEILKIEGVCMEGAGSRHGARCVAETRAVTGSAAFEERAEYGRWVGGLGDWGAIG